MDNWISIKDKLPERSKYIKFKLHGYEFVGEYCGTNIIIKDSVIVEYIFRGHNFNTDREIITTTQATHWKPYD